MEYLSVGSHSKKHWSLFLKIFFIYEIQQDNKHFDMLGWAPSLFIFTKLVPLYYLLLIYSFWHWVLSLEGRAVIDCAPCYWTVLAAGSTQQKLKLFQAVLTADQISMWKSAGSSGDSSVRGNYSFLSLHSQSHFQMFNNTLGTIEHSHPIFWHLHSKICFLQFDLPGR